MADPYFRYARIRDHDCRRGPTALMPAPSSIAARILIRLIVSISIGVCVTAGIPSPAWSHGVSGAKSSNYLVDNVRVEPANDNVDVRTIEAGNRLQLTVKGDSEVVVFGYSGEPYLRISARGTEVNAMSPAVQLNELPGPWEDIAVLSKPTGDVQWVMVDSDTTTEWKDHRARWGFSGLPPAVEANPEDEHLVIPNWEVPIEVSGQPASIEGSLSWVPATPALTKYLVAALGTLGLSALLIALSKKKYLFLGSLLAMLVVNLWHSFGSAGDSTEVEEMVRRVATDVQTLTVTAAGIMAFVVLAKRDGASRELGYYLALFAAVLITLFGGFSDTSSWSNSQVPFRWSYEWARWLVVVTLILGISITAASIFRLMRMRKELIAKAQN